MLLLQSSEGDILLVLDCTSKKLIFSHCTVTLTELQVHINVQGQILGGVSGEMT